MSNNKIYGTIIPELAITDTAAEGVCLGHHDGKVVFVPFTVPGDVAEVMLVRSKKNYADAFLRKIIQGGPDRIEPACRHFGLCGGCRWQHLSYEAQVRMKEKQVLDHLKRIGGITPALVRPIHKSPDTFHYRNKLEFTYSEIRWFTDVDKDKNEQEQRTLGFHLPGRFDKVFHVEQCLLQPDESNTIRNTALRIALDQNLSFCNRKNHEGFMRNLMIRNSSSGHWMVTVIFGENDPEAIHRYMQALKEALPNVQSWIYMINTKHNDALHDLEFHVFSGEDAFFEHMEHLQFRVGPLSFYQVNVPQALNMYRAVREMAGLSGHEIVYDLYTGTGTIALFVAPKAAKVVGIESVPQAISDANQNAATNGIQNVSFHCGDLAKTLTSSFMAENGRPDVIITDPPRSGMHPDVVAQIREAAPLRIVYVSCNPATQARDVALLKDDYELAEIRPFDMFPHTHHVENIALLLKK